MEVLRNHQNVCHVVSLQFPLFSTLVSMYAYVLGQQIFVFQWNSSTEQAKHGDLESMTFKEGWEDNASSLCFSGSYSSTKENSTLLEGNESLI
jgi:hypothetical protein